MRFSATILAFLSLATTAQAAEPTDAMKVSDSGVTRKVDCGGRDLTVTGDDDSLTVSGCAVINVVGDRNRMTAQMLPESSIAALGNHNHIVFLHTPGFEVPVRSTGTGNEIVPGMGRDAAGAPPAKLPAKPQ